MSKRPASITERYDELEVSVAVITAVLLSDGWHRVERGTFVRGVLVFTEENGVPITRPSDAMMGFEFKDADAHEWIHGVTKSLIAVKTREL